MLQNDINTKKVLLNNCPENILIHVNVFYTKAIVFCTKAFVFCTKAIVFCTKAIVFCTKAIVFYTKTPVKKSFRCGLKEKQRSLTLWRNL